MCNSDISFVECDVVNWYVDNGATNHVCNNEKLFKSFTPLDQSDKRKTANGIAVEAVSHGDLLSLTG